MQVFEGLSDEAKQALHAFGEDLETLENFTYLGCTRKASFVRKSYCRLVWLSVLWIHSARVFDVVVKSLMAEAWTLEVT